MEQNKEHIKEIAEIRNMMERSSRFLSLSGLSGVFAGVVALAGSIIAYNILDYGKIRYDEYLYFLNPAHGVDIVISLFYLGILVLILALGGGFFFSWRKARKKGLKMWDRSARRMYIQLFIPLIAGGFFCLILINLNYVGLLASATLIFYGLALVNAGKYTLNEVQYLGISEIILGILAGIFLDFGLIFWAVGFGLLHIIYGTVMYYKYERQK